MAEENYRSFSGEIRKLERKNEFILTVDVWSLNSKVTANKWLFTDMAGHKEQFVGKPLLIAYEQGGRKIGAGHNSTKKRNSEGREYLSYTGATDQRIIGSYSDNPDDIRLETDENGVEWIVGKADIWKWYAAEAAEKIEMATVAGRPMAISIEALVEEFHMEGGIEYEDKYIVLGTTLLGDNVNPAVKGAHIAALSEIAGEFEELKLRAASYIEPEGEKEEPLEELNNKPQINPKKRRGHKLKAFSKKQLASLSDRFDGYKVVAAGQNDNGIHVCLMSADGGTAVYTMENTDETIVPEKIVKNNAQVSFEFGEEAISIDCCDLTDELGANIVKANSQIDGLKTELETANNTIEAMRKAEQKRRVQAAKDKAITTLEAFNANREEKIGKEILNSVNEAIENGDYSECADKEGFWNGEEKVMNDVLAKCAAKQMEIDKLAASRKNSSYIWDQLSDPAESMTGVEAYIAEFGN